MLPSCRQFFLSLSSMKGAYQSLAGVFLQDYQDMQRIITFRRLRFVVHWLWPETWPFGGWQKRFIFWVIWRWQILLMFVKGYQKYNFLSTAALDKQHSNAGAEAARAMEGIAKQAQEPSPNKDSIWMLRFCQGYAAPAVYVRYGTIAQGPKRIARGGLRREQKYAIMERDYLYSSMARA